MIKADTRPFRHELKFIVNNLTAEILRQQVSMVCMPDPHVGEDGTYNIKSIYFDTKDDRFLNETLDGLNVRHKYRIRAYNTDLSRITLEKKLAESGLKKKESNLISLDMCNDMVYNGVFSADAGELSVVQDMQAESLLGELVPKVMIGYNRVPFIYPDGNVRITFDRNIVASSDVETFYKKGTDGLYEVIPNMQVLEVKYDEFLPQFIRNVINVSGVLEQTSFSKYAMGRMKLIEGALL